MRLFILFLITALFLTSCSQETDVITEEIPTKENLTIPVQPIVPESIPEITGEANLNFMYWPDRNMTYMYDLNYSCNAIELKLFNKAFAILNKTNISYVESEDAEIIIRCHDTISYEDAAGTANIQHIERQIQSAVINIYATPKGYAKCYEYPTVEMHEILHTLGFGHDTNRSSIMYTTDPRIARPLCATAKPIILDCIRNIYTNGNEGRSCEGIPYLD